LGCALGELASAMVVWLGQQRLSVALGERTVAEQMDRLVGEFEQPDGVR
jgi:hypothetical protein